MKNGFKHFQGVLEDYTEANYTKVSDGLASFMGPGGEPYPAGCGGAVCIALLNSPIRGVSMSISMKTSVFQRNRAVLGGNPSC